MLADLALLPDTMPAAAAWLLLGASFLTSLMTVTFGIGGGALLLGILAGVLPPSALIPVHGVVQLGSNATRAVMFRRHIARAPARSFLVGAAVGAVLGGMVAVELPAGLLQAIVGVFLIWTVLATPPRWLRERAWVTGAVSSFLTMFVGATGPFVATYVKALSLDRNAHTGTHAALMTAQHLLKIAVFGIMGFSFGPWLPLTIGMILSGMAGTFLGRVVLGRMSDHGFHRILNVVLILIALRLIWKGLAAG
ncbi:MAG: sulfite exporter TauE/SafE family protein [Rhodobacteraceae bacterium]|nr:sulfite exporter TauE/SafE family protein [Paracoccaceae bacterium]